MLSSFFGPELEVGVCPQGAYFLKVLSANPTLRTTEFDSLQF